MYDQLEVEETSFSFSNKAPSPPKNRPDTRHLKIMRVGTLKTGDRNELCLIRNIAAGGLMAHVYSPLSEGEEVSVSLKSNHELTGKVAWVRDANVGIAFDKQIDVEEMLSNPGMLENGWVPRMPRVEIDWLGTVRAGATTVWVSLRDISQGGVKFESDEPLKPGQPVVLTLDKFRSINCVVRWYENGAGGLSFNELVPFSELMGWLRTN
jgi:hypothetical protein